jgi:TPR repeat protein
MFCLSAKEDGWKYSKGDARPSFWFEQAASMGHKTAKFQLLKIRFRENFPADIIECAKIIKEIRELASKGLPEAENYLQKTEEELKKKAEAGIIGKNEAFSVLGDSVQQMYLAITYAEQNKMKESYNLVTLSAENGNPDAQLMLGLFYMRGTEDGIISKNPKEAVKWFKKASAAGKNDATIALGELCYVGLGCEKDLLEAANYFAKAADAGDASAANNAAICYKKYAFECAERKGLKNPVDRKLDRDYLRYMIRAMTYEQKAEELGYKEN